MLSQVLHRNFEWSLAIGLAPRDGFAQSTPDILHTVCPISIKLYLVVGQVHQIACYCRYGFLQAICISFRQSGSQFLIAAALTFRQDFFYFVEE